MKLIVFVWVAVFAVLICGAGLYVAYNLVFAPWLGLPEMPVAAAMLLGLPIAGLFGMRLRLVRRR